LRVVGFVPAKGSSDRIPSKNMRILDGEFLFRRKLRQMLESGVFDEVWLDTESEEIAALAADLPVKRLRRDPALASNATDGHELFANACRAVPGADLYVQALCTAPFVGPETFRRAVAALREAPQADSLVAVTTEKHYAWAGGDPAYGRGRIPNSVDLPPQTIEAMSLYMMRATAADFPDKRFGRSPLLFELTTRERLDINWQEDLDLAETICAGERQREVMLFRALRPHLSASVFSDLTKEMGLSCTLPAAIRPLAGRRILGRAKTLKLVALPPGATRESGEWKGIYDALKSYAFLRAGDVIVVSTEVPERAYFGELNAHLAMRAGAVGVVVDGYTRDIEAVAPLDLPVFARGASANDIKYEGTTGAMNTSVAIGDVPVRNNDVVFADADGVVVIPRERWDEVLRLGLDAIVNESRVRLNAALGRPVDELLEKFGYF
jgi:regulator of RNase E activity RraA/CMP-N-acetylneuraminic acid synthetase